MTSEEIIRDGLLEAYALGQLSGADALAVQAALRADAALRQELERIELALERAALEQAVAPAPHVKARLQEAVWSERRSAPRVIALGSDGARARWNWLAAAATIALLLSAGLNIAMLLQLREARKELARMNEERSVLAEELRVQRASLADAQRMLAVVGDPRLKVVSLAGTGSAPGALARVYWDPEASSVHIGALRLPAPPPGKQYQLWAIADGQPVDAGTIPLGAQPGAIHAMKAIGRAQAFAVTLEEEGGRPTPTLEAMVLVGQV
ncbi:MAG: anti-sigma factor domain-containing protein [Flavobacteriales bacterium]